MQIDSFQTKNIFTTPENPGLEHPALKHGGEWFVHAVTTVQTTVATSTTKGLGRVELTQEKDQNSNFSVRFLLKDSSCCIIESHLTVSKG